MKGPFRGTQRDFNCLFWPPFFCHFFFPFCPEDVSGCCLEGQEEIFPRDVNFKAEWLSVTRPCWKYPSRFARLRQGSVCLTCAEHRPRKRARTFRRFLISTSVSLALDCVFVNSCGDFPPGGMCLKH